MTRELTSLADIASAVPSQYEVEGKWFAVTDFASYDNYFYLVVQQEGTQARQAVYLDREYVKYKDTFTPDIFLLRLQAAAHHLLDKAASAKVREIADKGVGDNG